MRRSQHRLAAAIEEHRAALDADVKLASQVPEHRWHRRGAAGKWSPGEITEHLRLSLEKLREALRREGTMKCALPWWKRLWLRRTVLARTFRGALPEGSSGAAGNPPLDLRSAPSRGPPRSRGDR